MAKDKQIQKAQTTAPAFNIEALISQAVAKDASVESLQSLLAMRKELKAEWAETEFVKAKAAFQKECPRIKKNKAVYEKDRKTVRYKYADLGDISEQIKEPLANNGLSYSFNPKQENNMIGITCTLTHIAGHSETTEPFYLPIGSEQFMSEVQKFGARMTFAKRYILLMALGINTAEDDTDAGEEPKKEIKGKNITAAQIDFINKITTLPKLNSALKAMKEKLGSEYANSILEHYTRRKEEIENKEVEEMNEAADDALSGGLEAVEDAGDK